MQAAARPARSQYRPQCKQWKRDKVPVNVVREMYGLLGLHHADEVRIATLGGYTPDAQQFAAGKPIELIDGAQLLGMISRVQADTSRHVDLSPPDPLKLRQYQDG